MVVLYLDSLFLLNFILDYLLLLATGKLAGLPLPRLRLGLAALVGGLYAVAVCLVSTALRHPLCILAVGVGMVWLSFGSPRLLKCSLLFFGLGATLGGGILALSYLGAGGLSLYNGLVYSPIPLSTLLLFSLLAYLVITLVFRHLARHDHTEVETAVLTLDGRRVALKALIDSGNTLVDPVTGRPVLVAEGQVVAPLLTTDPPLDQAHLSDPIHTLSQLGEGPYGKRFRLLPYRAVGVDCGFLLALRVDGVRVGCQDLGSILVALSPYALSDGGPYCGLIGSLR